MVVTTDYSNRTRDIHILHGANPQNVDAQSVVPEFGIISGFCAGVQKLVQRYTISLLTNITSQYSFPDFGTNFIQGASSTVHKVNMQDLYHLFAFANAKVLYEFRDYQAAHKDLPLDEQLNYTIVQNITGYGGSLFLTVKLVTLAGDNLTYVLPLPKP